MLDGVEILDPTQSNAFDYEERTQSVYISGQGSLGDKWETKMGLRYEWTQTEGFSRTADQLNLNAYQQLFPTFYLAYTPNENHAFSLNYGRRIQRPTYSYLNPFRFVSNPFSFSEGNPLFYNLLSQTILSLNMHWGITLLPISIFRIPMTILSK
ncbi:MAG: TonB-dependent receptor [Saprospiraceae bacterium]|nr:TonB-dependent receptor [Saprospiraceae bacterium]